MTAFYKIFLGLILLQSNLSFAQGKIIMNGAKINVVDSAFVVTTDISLKAGDTLNINNSTIKIAGRITNNSGAFDVTKGTVEMNGSSAQTIPSNAFITNKIRNLVISNNVTLAGEDSLTGVLSFGAVDSTSFSTAGFLTLRSSVSGTAQVADLTNDDVNSGNQVLGDVTVESYIPARKAWWFLSIPTNTTQTIKKTWQEGSTANGNALPGYGTQITGPGGLPAGFDVATSTPSMKTYNSIANTWTAIPNTNTMLINSPVNNTTAYFVFVRGNRSATLTTSPLSPTILRTKGVIKQGVQAVITVRAPATAFTSVGNPYPSPIDLRKMTPAPTTSTKIYVWDPFSTSGSSTGLGAYQTLTYDGSDFVVTPGGGSYGASYKRNPNFIEGGEAFLVGGNASPYNITFKEDMKSPAVNKVLFTYGLKQSLQVSLFTNLNGVTLLMDGIRADIGSNFSNFLDNDDAFKLLGSTENVSLKRNGQLLSVERHDVVTIQDTFFLNTGNVRILSYQWQVNMNNLDQPGLSGFLEDNYLHTSTPLNLNGSTIANFSIANIAGSYAANRFTIVFKQLSTLAVTFTSVKAYQQNKNIAVDWKAENESNLVQYDVQKSIDGNHYTIATTVAAKNAISGNYSWLDVNPSDGYNYYRILSTDKNGKTMYSTIVKVFMGKGKQAISIYPNPIINGTINLQLTNQPAGEYGIRLINNIGQSVITKKIIHEEGSSTETIQIDKNTAHGIYQLEVTKPEGSTMNIELIY